MRLVALWAGLFAAPSAWAAQLVLGYGVEEADCSAAGSSFDLDTPTWEAAIFGACGAVALAALVGAMWQWRETRDANGLGRIGFMAFGGILISALFLALIVLTGVGVLTLTACKQG
jgi:hypothetical protein